MSNMHSLTNVDWVLYRHRESFSLYELACLIHSHDPEAVNSDALAALRQAPGVAFKVLVSSANPAALMYASPDMYFIPPVGETLERLKKFTGMPMLGGSIDKQKAREVAEVLGYPWPRQLDCESAVTTVVEPTPDIAGLATPSELIEAFGRYTGMSIEWFDNLKDAPRLKEARKIAGQGGRGHIREPLFCPFLVMQWLADPKRKRGSKLSENKAWELLERYFPQSYNAHSVHDPRVD